MIKIEINGQSYTVEQGAMIIEVADRHGVHIPRFCYHKKLSIAANCRMCLVEVDKARKPMPACATPVTDGMKVFTRSPMALKAQRAVMEFLLINHPLDCPICDQGGECELQDVSLGYGKSISRFTEGKRAVHDLDIGPLIQTDMTRCIHCTRCVRFGTEVAGIRELGAVNRGEHMEITTYIEKSVDSELSGNVIDICPVGALTSKPYRYSARAWELQQYATIAPHDCLGSHMNVHVLRHQVKRAVPREMEAINEVWLSDRDRFSYEALQSPDRITTPWIKRNNVWEETDWETAVTVACEQLDHVRTEQGSDAIVGLMHPSSATEEAYLFQALLRGMGSPHMDYRLRRVDFSDQAAAPLYPTMGISIESIADCQAIVLIGSHLRKEQPLLSHRLLKATKNGAVVSVINPVAYEFNFSVANEMLVSGGDLLQGLLAVAKALDLEKNKDLPSDARAVLEKITVTDTARAIARQCQQAEQAVLWLGALALHHPDAAHLRFWTAHIAEATGAKWGVLTEGANAAGCALMGVLPHRGPGGVAQKTAGFPVAEQWKHAPKAFLLWQTEPELDCANSYAALGALTNAECVVVGASYWSAAMREYANVVLPVAPFAETEGSFMNAEGRLQKFNAAIQPMGDSRPGWKVLRVLGEVFNVANFNFTTFEEVHLLVCDVVTNATALPSQQDYPATALRLPLATEKTLMLLTETALYGVDAMTRRAESLQKTCDAQMDGVRVHPETAAKNQWIAGKLMMIKQGTAALALPLVIDHRIPENCAHIFSGTAKTVGLQGGYSLATLEQG